MENYGDRLREAIGSEPIIPLIGVYDVFSASIAARYYKGLFISGFSFAASHYGLPDIGFIAWSDIVDFVQRNRTILPQHHIVVDIDDGYCDAEVACHVVSMLERIGASGVILEDQQRPRKCGHLDSKEIMALDPFLEKLSCVLKTRDNLFVVARTDATDEEEAFRRAQAFAEVGADAILVEAVKRLDFLQELKDAVKRPLVFNQIAGGKSPPVSLSQLQGAGVSLVNYSTPCLFAAYDAVHTAMQALQQDDGLLSNPAQGSVNVTDCTAFLNENIRLRNET